MNEITDRPQQLAVGRVLPAKVFVVAGYLFYLGAIVPAIRIARGENFFPGASDPISTVIQGAVIASAALFVLFLDRRVWRLLRTALPFALLVALCLASALWSPFPDVTLRRGIAMIGCLMVAAIAFTSFGLKGTASLVGTATTLGACLSLAVYLLLPSVGQELEIYGGGIRGVFAQKNAMAGAMLPGIASYLYLWVRDPQRRGSVANAAFLVLMIVLAQSLLALAIAFLLVALGLLFKISPKQGARAALLYFYVMASAFAVVFVAIFPEDVAEFFGRDLTLTGRIGLWELSLRSTANDLLVGHGYAGFWNLAAQETQYIHYYMNWAAPDAHNGYIDLLLQLGLAGCAIVAWIMLRILTFCLGAFRSGDMPELPFAAMIIAIVVAINFGESRLVEPGWALLLLFATWLALSESPHRARDTAIRIGSFGRRSATQVSAGHVSPIDKAATQADQAS